jgi:hypothetical protein
VSARGDAGGVTAGSERSGQPGRYPIKVLPPDQPAALILAYLLASAPDNQPISAHPCDVVVAREGNGHNGPVRR